MQRPRLIAEQLYPRLPRTIQQALLVPHRSKLWIQRGILFIHIPKAAGTSINQALYGRFIGHPRAADIERWGSKQLRALPRFSVTRNPWDRLLSAYRFAKRGIGIADETAGQLVAGIWKPEQYRILEFDTFERFVIEWLPGQNLAALDFVFQPQSAFVCDASCRVLVNHLGRVEDLGPTVAFIEDTLGQKLGIPWTNLSGQRVDYRSVYTAEMAAIAAEVYREDIATFGYDF